MTDNSEWALIELKPGGQSYRVGDVNIRRVASCDDPSAPQERILMATILDREEVDAQIFFADEETGDMVLKTVRTNI